ncbi:TatD family hydrolase [Candidatus Gottesmanbacteria bacterium]|nr:TatD family hydrolase [Candidatus Gottesmanbacteria bacterium]
MYIDTHCHLNFPQYNQDRAMVIGNAKKVGVKKFVNPGVDPLSCQQALEVATHHPDVVFPAIGFHPYEAQDIHDVSLLESLAQKHHVVAIGECGLDYHQYEHHTAAGRKDNQKNLFTLQLELALQHNLPVIMHCRDAYEDFFDVLDSLPSLPRGVIHCFSGGLQELRMAIERKFFVGFDGNVTYSKQLWVIVPNIPLSMVLLETDAPFLTPLPHRGTRNEPKYIPLIAKKVAELHKISEEQVEKITTQNAFSLFGI